LSQGSAVRGQRIEGREQELGKRKEEREIGDRGSGGSFFD